MKKIIYVISLLCLGGVSAVSAHQENFRSHDQSTTKRLGPFTMNVARFKAGTKGKKITVGQYKEIMFTALTDARRSDPTAENVTKIVFLERDHKPLSPNHVLWDNGRGVDTVTLYLYVTSSKSDKQGSSLSQQ